jgi:uncharacterized protein (DUF427 family)
MATQVSEAMPRDLRFEPTPKRVRAERGGETLVDSKRAVLVWEPDRVVPLYAFPADDVRTEVLPDDALRRYDDEDLAGYVGIAWRALDRWLEEEEEVVAHPRDPFKRVDIRASSRHVVVRIDGEVVAETRRPHLLFETGLPVRYYMPREDVHMELLSPSDTVTRCAYKGEASHWSARVGDEVHQDVAWAYPEPLPDHPQIRGLIAFYNERTDFEVDGELQERPETQWSLR